MASGGSVKTKPYEIFCRTFSFLFGKVLLSFQCHTSVHRGVRSDARVNHFCGILTGTLMLESDKFLLSCSQVKVRLQLIGVQTRVFTL